jgi:hypothetical protein
MSRTFLRRGPLLMNRLRRCHNQASQGLERKTERPQKERDGPRKVKVSVFVSCQGQIYALAYIVSFAVVKTILFFALTPGANIIKLFIFITYEWDKFVRAFVPGRPLQPSLMFTVEHRSLPWRGAPERGSSQEGSRLTCNYYTRLEKLVSSQAFLTSSSVKNTKGFLKVRLHWRDFTGDFALSLHV